ncbi:hypothetical protein CTH_0455 [Carboxydocella thermautotrophica]|nr:hypothetical protein CTH_0455 [Carboxydocella thermautotrophica]
MAPCTVNFTYLSQQTLLKEVEVEVMFLIIWGMLGFAVFFLFTLKLSSNKEHEELNKLIKMIKILIFVSLISIAFFYLSYYSLYGNWPVWLSIIFLAVTIGWPFFSIYAWVKENSNLKKYLPAITLWCSPLVILAASDDFERLFNIDRVPREFIPLIILLLFTIGILSWSVPKMR